MGIRFWIYPVSLILLLVIVLGTLTYTPLGLLIRLMDPSGGIFQSGLAGLIPGRMVIHNPDLGGEVLIVFDGDGIPHIYAEYEEDAFYAIGYIHAWFRLWQMDIQRRLASGRIAEVIGKDGLGKDIFMRILGLHRSALNTSIWIRDNYPEVYRLLEYYSMGVNDAIDRMRREGTLPLMFKLLDYEPEEWRPVDSILWAKYMAWSLTSFWYPLILSYLRAYLGAEDLNILYPVHPYYSDNITIIPGDGSIDGKRINVDPYYLRTLDWLDEWATGIDHDDPLFRDMLTIAFKDIMGLISDPPGGIGSNNWAISPSRSMYGAAMMADDPHLPISLPSLWFLLHVKAGDELDVIGVTLPGIPFIIIGSNRYISWGLTNSQIGVMDLYVEKIHPVDRDKYLFNGEWRSIGRVREVIRVKGMGEETIIVNYTIHGPILTMRGLTISFKWAGNAGYDDKNSGVTREAIAIYYVNKARNLGEFLDALRFWDIPPQNFMYADVEGNIAVVVPGLFPVRSLKLPTGNVVEVVGIRGLLNGTGGYEWVKYIPYNDVPMSVNPGRGFLAAPNQMTVGPYYPYFILAGWWDRGSRAHRLYMLIESRELIGLEDMMEFQSDIFDWYAYQALPLMIESIRGLISGRYLEILGLLDGWDYRMDKDGVEPTIWWAWFTSLNDLMYRGYLEDMEVEHMYYPMHDTTLWLLRNMRGSKWFRDGFNETIREAFIRAIDTLSTRLGEDIDLWRWGRIHKLYIRHLSMLDELSRGPYPEDGGDNVLMAASIPWNLSILDGEVYVSSGPSWRIITIMDPMGLNVYGVYPGGQSGNPASNLYDNYIELWLGYRYLELGFPRDVNGVTDRRGFIRIIGGGA